MTTTTQKPTNKLYVLQESGHSVEAARYLIQVIDDHPYADERSCGVCSGWSDSSADGMNIWWSDVKEEADAQAACAL